VQRAVLSESTIEPGRVECAPNPFAAQVLPT
jgi:hypothetical protein